MGVRPTAPSETSRVTSLVVRTVGPKYYRGLTNTRRALTRFRRIVRELMEVRSDRCDCHGALLTAGDRNVATNVVISCSNTRLGSLHRQFVRRTGTAFKVSCAKVSPRARRNRLCVSDLTIPTTFHNGNVTGVLLGTIVRGKERVNLPTIKLLISGNGPGTRELCTSVKFRCIGSTI